MCLLVSKRSVPRKSLSWVFKISTTMPACCPASQFSPRRQAAWAFSLSTCAASRRAEMDRQRPLSPVLACIWMSSRLRRFRATSISTCTTLPELRRCLGLRERSTAPALRLVPSELSLTSQIRLASRLLMASRATWWTATMPATPQRATSIRRWVITPRSVWLVGCARTLDGLITSAEPARSPA